MKGYKTLIVNGALVLVPIVDVVANNSALVQSMLGKYGAAVVSVIGLVNLVLRWVTTTPVLKSE